MTLLCWCYTSVRYILMRGEYLKTLLKPLRNRLFVEGQENQFIVIYNTDENTAFSLKSNF